jgi:DinB superfamily
MTHTVNPLNDELNQMRRRAEALVNGLTTDQLTRRLDPGKWSIAECLAHLNLTASVVQPIIGKGIAKGKREKRLGKGPFKLGVRGRLLVWIAEPPPKFRMPAPKAVAPPVSIQQPSQILADFMKAQDEWQRLWNEADGLNMAGINIGPLLSPFRCHLSASFPWMMAHQRRHLLQAENVKRKILSDASASSAKRA